MARLEDILVRSILGARGLFEQQQAAQAQARQQQFQNRLDLMGAQADLARATPTPTPRLGADVISAFQSGDPERIRQAVAQAGGLTPPQATAARGFIPEPDEPEETETRIPAAATEALFQRDFPRFVELVGDAQFTAQDVADIFGSLPEEPEKVRTVNLRAFGTDLPDLEVEEGNAATIARAIREGAPIQVTEGMKRQFPDALGGFEVGAFIRPDVLQTLTRAEVQRGGLELEEDRFQAQQEQWQKEFGLRASAAEFDQLLRTRQQDWTEEFQGLQNALRERGLDLDERAQEFNQTMEQKRLELDREVAANRISLDQAKLELDRAALDFAEEKFNLELAAQREETEAERAAEAAEAAREAARTIEVTPAVREALGLPEVFEGRTITTSEALQRIPEDAEGIEVTDQLAADLQLPDSLVGQTLSASDVLGRVGTLEERDIREPGVLEVTEALRARFNLPRELVGETLTISQILDVAENPARLRSLLAQAKIDELKADFDQQTFEDRVQEAKRSAQIAGLEETRLRRTLESRIREANVGSQIDMLRIILDAFEVQRVDPIDLLILQKLVDEGQLDPSVREALLPAIDRIPGLRAALRETLGEIGDVPALDALLGGGGSGAQAPASTEEGGLTWPEDVTVNFRRNGRPLTPEQNEVVKRLILREIQRAGGAAALRRLIQTDEATRNNIAAVGIPVPAITATLQALENEGL